LRYHGKVITPGFQSDVAKDQTLMLQQGLPGRKQAMFKAAALDHIERLRRLETRIDLRHVYRLKGHGKTPA